MKTLKHVSVVLSLYMLAALALAQEEQTITFMFSPGDTVWDIWNVSGSGPWIEFREAALRLNPVEIAQGFENISIGAEIEIPLALLDIGVNRVETAPNEALVGDMALVPLDVLEQARANQELLVAQGLQMQALSESVSANSAELSALREANSRALVSESDFPLWLLLVALLFLLLALILLSQWMRVSSARRDDKRVYEQDLDAVQAKLARVEDERDQLRAQSELQGALLVSEKDPGSFEEQFEALRAAHREDLDALAFIHNKELAQKKREYREITERQHATIANAEQAIKRLETEVSTLRLENSKLKRDEMRVSRRRGTRGGGRHVKPSP